ncbi:21 kDa protein-like [Magnolia sinica]|uniref:21 kDa protein-like n=1 Tax=Magnolia sinica TaxID=86752 RepID=UPI00265A009F|nr:21 kDa protein-like [Magnolia sinica]
MENYRSSSSSYAPYTLIAAMLSLLVCSAAQTIDGQTNAEFINSDGQTNADFIKSSCKVTRYPRVCFDSLSVYANTIQTSPQRLAQAALSVSLASAQSTKTMMSRLLKGRGMNPREMGALRDCIENIGDSIDEVKKSIEEMSHLSDPDFEFHKENIQTWVSAALTDEDTCTDGFAGNGMNGNVKSAITSRVVNLSHLTSNALALINSLTSTQPTSR